MKEENIVIGIEGLVGSGKTSICRKLLDYIPNSIILHGGNIYRAVVYGMMNSGIDLKNIKNKSKNLDVMDVMQKLGIDIKLENRETVIYINNKKIDEEELQSDKSSMAVSVVSNVADNTKFYQFGKEIIDKYREKYNVILSSRDIVKMYPNVTYHFFITATLDERVRRKSIQYKEKIDLKKLKENIEKRDKLQEDSGYYKIYDITNVIDITNCKTIEEGAKLVLDKISLPLNV